MRHGRLPVGTGSTPSGAPRSSAGLGFQPRYRTAPNAFGGVVPRQGFPRVSRYCAPAHPLSNLARKPLVKFHTLWAIPSVHEKNCGFSVLRIEGRATGVRATDVTCLEPILWNVSCFSQYPIVEANLFRRPDRSPLRFVGISEALASHRLIPPVNVDLPRSRSKDTALVTLHEHRSTSRGQRKSGAGCLRRFGARGTRPPLTLPVLSSPLLSSPINTNRIN